MLEPPSTRRWQFSIRAILILMVVLAAVTTFAANRPELALTTAICAAGILFQSGVIFFLVANLAKTKVFAQRPYLAIFVWLAAGLTSIAIGSRFAWILFHPKYFGTFLLQMSAAIVFGGFGGYCFWWLWKSFLPLTVPKPIESADQQPQS